MAVLLVEAREDGEKLLRFLERRLLEAPPPSVLHRWIRTGQVRVNGGRAKPFAPLRENDEVRLPPFAVPRPLDGVPPAGGPGPDARPSAKRGDLQKGAERGAIPEGAARHDARKDAERGEIPADARLSPEPSPDLGADLRVVAVFEDLLVLAKPAGLATQPGSGRDDSVVRRLRAAYAGRAFIPAPAHRLDAPTSGLLLAALSQKARTELHAAFAAGTVRKEYLAWAGGVLPRESGFDMLDTLEKQANAAGFERVAASADGKEARARVTVLRRPPPRETPGRARPPFPACLLHILLLTGRTHQIRAQLALRGLPVVGDRKYHGPAHAGLLLHCFRLTLPDGRVFELPPPWPAPFAVGDIR